MSDPYTPLFKDILLSSVWAESSDTRIVWIAMMALAGPDGYVPGTVTGIANAARVGVEATRAALAVLEAPDPESRTPDHDGRRIERVERGWVLLNYVAHRKRAQEAARRFKKTQAMRKLRARSVDTRGQSVVENAPTQTETQTQTPPQKEGSPLPPRVGVPCPCGDEARPGHPQGWCDYRCALPVVPPGDGLRPLAPEPATGSPAVWFTLDGWEPTRELRSDAALAGVPPEVFEARLADLRNGPIGGRRGVIDRNAYVRTQFPKWRAWYEEQRAREQSKPPGRVLPPPEPIRPRRKERDHAVRWGYDIDAIFDAVNAEGWVASKGAEGARQEAQRRMAAAAKAGRQGPEAVP